MPGRKKNVSTFSGAMQGGIGVFVIWNVAFE